MQLVAYGAQDVYLTGNPVITFFKVVYKRYTNFAMEAIEQTFTGGGAGFGKKTSCVINRQGDLISRVYLKVELNDVKLGPEYNDTSVAWVRRLGFALFESVEIEIGGARVDRHFGVWYNIWYELTHCENEERGYREMIGDVEELTQLKKVSDCPGGLVLRKRTLFIPLQFWFCRNIGLALPLVALQYHETRIYIDFANVSKLIVWSGPRAPDTSKFTINDASLLVDFIYLDSEERRRFAQIGHEYLIEQLQFTGHETLTDTHGSSTSGKYKLSFNHPTKELIWALSVGAFNGAGISSTNNSKGKFLCYTHDDNKWDDALDYAATNVANSMVNCVIQSGITRSNSALASGDLVFVDYSSSHELITANGLNLKLYVTFENAETGVLISEADAEAANVNVTLNTKPLHCNSFNLANGLLSIDLTVKLLVSGVSPNLVMSVPLPFTNYKVVTVIQHKLTLDEVSIPVNHWTDTRQLTEDKALDVSVIQPHNFGLRLDGKGNPVSWVVLQFNGHERFHNREGSYFNYVQPYQHHTRTPCDGVNVYSFALNPENHQPSGTANLSRIDTTLLSVQFNDSLRSGLPVRQLNFSTDSRFYIYAVNYNVLRIMSGMGGLAYSN